MNKKINCLLIDDDFSDKNVLERFVVINNLDYEIAHADSLKKAFEQLAAKKFDVIISDISFSDGDIFKILEKTKRIPLIVVSSEGEEELAAQIMKSGATEYIIKDMKRNYLEALPNIIEKAVRTKNNELLLTAFVDTLTNLNMSFCTFNSFGEILFSTQRFREMFSLKNGAFLINIKKVLGSIFFNGQKYTEMELDKILGDEVNFFLTLKDKRKVDMRLLPIRDNMEDIIGYIWMEKKCFK